MWFLSLQNCYKTVDQRRHFQDWLRCPSERWIGHEESWWIAPTAMYRLNKMGGLHGQSLVPKSFQRWVALFHVPFTNICFYRDMCATIPFVSSPGMRQMEWSFLSCHNYWIVCRFVRDDDHPYDLAYSSEITHRSLFELSSVLFYLLSRMSLSSVACTVQIWNLISSRTTIPYYERMRIANLI